MGCNEEKGKSRKDSSELRILYFIWVLGAPYYLGGCIGWVGDVQNIENYLTTKILCQGGHIQLLSQILKAVTVHVWPPARTFSGLSLISGYPSLIRLLIRVLESYPRNIRPLARTCLASQPYHRSTQPYSVPRSGSREVGRTCSASRPGHVRVSDTPTARFPWGAIKGPLTSLARLATHIDVQTLWDTFFSSQPLSSKLHSNPSFLGEIWASLLSDHSIFN
jgi:hypothetical protein